MEQLCFPAEFGFSLRFRKFQELSLHTQEELWAANKTLLLETLRVPRKHEKPSMECATVAEFVAYIKGVKAGVKARLSASLTLQQEKQARLPQRAAFSRYGPLKRSRQPLLVQQSRSAKDTAALQSPVDQGMEPELLRLLRGMSIEAEGGAPGPGPDEGQGGEPEEEKK